MFVLCAINIEYSPFKQRRLMSFLLNNNLGITCTIDGAFRPFNSRYTETRVASSFANHNHNLVQQVGLIRWF